MLNIFKKQYDIVAIGETTIDAFIRLSDATVKCELGHDHGEDCKLCIAYGAKIPYDFVVEIPAVGNAANASVAISRLGLGSALIANVGKDRNGDMCTYALKKEGVATEYVKINNDKPTNYHYVLWFQEDRTILQKHSDFEYTLPEMKNPKWIYLTSLGEKSLPYHETIANYLEKNPTVKLAFQPGIFQIKMGTNALKRIYSKTEISFCNLEEAEQILNSKDSDIKTLLAGIRNLGVKIAVITDGPKGAYVSYGDKTIFMPPYPDPKSPYERTGAGDAFSSTFVAAIAMGKSVEEAITWAPINSMSVVQEIGAQKGLLTEAGLKEWLSKAPENYKVKEI